MKYTIIYSDYTSSVLASVLEHGQGIIQSLIDWAFTHYSDNTTHAIYLFKRAL
jgi:hypothetical protein